MNCKFSILVGLLCAASVSVVAKPEENQNKAEKRGGMFGMGKPLPGQSTGNTYIPPQGYYSTPGGSAGQVGTPAFKSPGGAAPTPTRSLYPGLQNGVRRSPRMSSQEIQSSNMQGGIPHYGETRSEFYIRSQGVKSEGAESKLKSAAGYPRPNYSNLTAPSKRSGSPEVSRAESQPARENMETFSPDGSHSADDSPGKVKAPNQRSGSPEVSRAESQPGREKMETLSPDGSHSADDSPGKVKAPNRLSGVYGPSAETGDAAVLDVSGIKDDFESTRDRLQEALDRSDYDAIQLEAIALQKRINQIKDNRSEPELKDKLSLVNMLPLAAEAAENLIAGSSSQQDAMISLGIQKIEKAANGLGSGAGASPSKSRK